MDIRKVIDRYVGIPVLAFLNLIQPVKIGRSVPQTPPPPRNVLIIYLSGVGDTVMVVTCLALLARRFPTARFSFLTSSQNFDIVKDNPLITEHLCLNTKNGIFGFLASVVTNLTTIQRKKYDVTIDFEQFLRLSAIVSSLSNAPVSLGFNNRKQFRHHGYSHPTRFTPWRHTMDNFVSLLAPLGLGGGYQTLEEIPVSQENRLAVERLLETRGVTKEDLVIGIHAGSGGTALSRRWDPLKFGTLARLLAQHFNAVLIFTGSDEEHEMIERIRATIPASRFCLNFAGKCTLAQLPHLIAHCNVFISNDTGPMHVAAAMKTPVVALFGPNSPLRYGPVGEGHHVIYKALKCSPCILAHEGIVPHCPDNECMKQINVAEVWKTLRMVLSEAPPHPPPK